jgi:hypothetical protein
MLRAQAYRPTPAIQHSESTSQSRSKPLRQFIALPFRRRSVGAVAGEQAARQPDRGAPSYDSRRVDFVNPTGSGRRSLGGGWEAGLYEAGGD